MCAACLGSLAMRLEPNASLQNRMKPQQFKRLANCPERGRKNATQAPPPPPPLFSASQALLHTSLL